MLGESKPEWLKIRPPREKEYSEVKLLAKEKGLATVCEEAHCPNISECWSSGTATFMVMGSVCTRGCRFCAVKTALKGEELDKSEPERLARAVREMNLDYAVITSVDRDDLPDQGAGHFADCVKAVRRESPKTIVEILIPDFGGKKELVGRIALCGAHVVSHNIETVRELQGEVRDQRANYEQSLLVLREVKETNPSVFTKSGIMLGLGETREQVLRAMKDLREVGVDFLTIGQYLRPGKEQLPTREFVSPGVFEELRKKALELGFRHCASGPMVRSSYKAGEFFIKNAPNPLIEE